MPTDTPPDPTLPIAHSVLAAEAIARLVDRHYTVGPTARCRLLRRGFNEVYVVACEDGARYVARLGAIRARGAANIDYEVALLEHVAARGAAVGKAVRPASGRAGVSVALPEGRRTLAVFEHLDGDPPDGLDDVELAGAALAGLHAASADYAGPASLYRGGIEHLLSAPLSRLLQAPTLNGELRSRLQRLVPMLEAGPEVLSSLTEVACHGDCHGGNNFVRTSDTGERVAELFDFDDAVPGYLAYDLAVYLWSQLLRRSLAAPDAEALEHWSRFLAGYERLGDVAAADIHAIPRFVALRHVWFLGELAGRAHHWGTEALPTRWLLKQLDLLERWIDLDASRLRPDGRASA